MCNHILIIIYNLFIEASGTKIHRIEQLLGFDGYLSISADDRINVAEMYSVLFKDECKSKVENLYLTLLCELQKVQFEHCSDLLEALVFVQHISTTALWKYHLNVGQQLETFVRDFDRLDVDSERKRLFEYAQIYRLN